MNNSDTIIVPANKIIYLKDKSKLFDILISNNFSNSSNYFTKDGDYIIKKETVFPLNSPTHRQLVARDTVFEQLRNTLMGKHIPIEEDAEFIKEYFMFNKNFNFFNPTLEEQSYIERKKMNITKKNNSNNLYKFNNYNYESNYNSSNNSNSTKKNNNRNKNNINISNDNMNNYNNNVMKLIKKAKKTYSKYPKSGKRPSKHNKYRATKKLYKD